MKSVSPKTITIQTRQRSFIIHVDAILIFSNGNVEHQRRAHHASDVIWNADVYVSNAGIYLWGQWRYANEDVQSRQYARCLVLPVSRNFWWFNANHSTAQHSPYQTPNNILAYPISLMQQYTFKFFDVIGLSMAWKALSTVIPHVFNGWMVWWQCRLTLLEEYIDGV